jgi:hypothetical protein
MATFSARAGSAGQVRRVRHGRFRRGRSSNAGRKVGASFAWTPQGSARIVSVYQAARESA